MSEDNRDNEKEGTDDVVVFVGKSEEGHLQGLRGRDGQIELAEFAPVEEGKPITGELVRFKERAESPVVWDVEVLHEAPPRDTRKGPAKVASDAYRDGWERIFGAPRTRHDDLPN